MPDNKIIFERIEDKKEDYKLYGFSQIEDTAFKSFFDLSQEFDDLDDFYDLCTAIPASFFGKDSRLYIIENNNMNLVSCMPKDKCNPSYQPIITDYPYSSMSKSLLLPIRGKGIRMEKHSYADMPEVMGVLEVSPADGLSEHDTLFYEKFANRIGFNLHNKFLLEKNIEHLRFIKTLIADIEHNIITPNMVYKLLLRNLSDRISKNQQVEVLLGEYLELEEVPEREDILNFLNELEEINKGLYSELSALEKHYRNVSLFLETLLRRGHFDEGRLIARTKRCNMKKDVLGPQLDQYIERFKRMGITIDDRMSGIPDEDIVGVVDIGLMSQVYANLFSNALKYTKEVSTHTGERIKYVAYGREFIMDFFGPGKDGVKYNVFTTGPHINPDEHKKVFDEGYRGRDSIEKPGTGHGLAFIKSVIEIHNGVIGYEPTQYGNNFYFILPALD